IKGVLEKLANYGVVNVRHAHGDWSSKNLSGWKEKLHANAIRPMQQFAYTQGKNATDSAMIIDAMDILYSKNISAFALMTSDSDFTPLVHRILEDGLEVYGFGENKTPKPFVNACSQFIYTEKLDAAPSGNSIANVKKTKKMSPENLKKDTDLVKLLETAVKQAAGDDGWSHLGEVGKYLSNISSFSPKKYGYQKSGELIRAIKLFETKHRKNNKSSMYIRKI
ncbi:MAG: NYN domain-containing protein, partial [Ghiorsea sp.]|nr:NYN domain-containing protein [Ghiorsea sp.]